MMSIIRGLLYLANYNSRNSSREQFNQSKLMLFHNTRKLVVQWEVPSQFDTTEPSFNNATGDFCEEKKKRTKTTQKGQHVINMSFDTLSGSNLS